MASSPSRRKGRRRSPWIRRLKWAGLLFTLFFFTGVACLFGLFMLKYREAEDAMGDLGERMAEVSRPPSRVVTSDGKVLFQISEENRVPMKLSQIPKHVRNAVLAAEDKRFYDHSGVDALGLLRAFVSVFKEGRVAQGGSTITMQLAKRLYSGNERTFMRKIQDIAFATAIEKEVVNKNRILELYLNQVYFGEGAYGIGAAAKVYLNKRVEDLSVSDAALLARCVRLPSRDNPIESYDVAMNNRDTVLRIMREEKMISEEELRDALAESPKLNKRPPKTTAFYPAGYGRHFVDHVLDFLEKENVGIDLKRGGYTVYTTLDSRLQKLAQRTVIRVVRENRHQMVNEGAFIAIDKDGKILCEVGGVDYNRSAYNIVTQSDLQPGSSFKAIVYAAALKDGILHSASDMVSNAPIYIQQQGQEPYNPRNSARWETASAYTLRTAFGYSINRCALNTSYKVGEKRVANVAQSVFGFRSPIRAVPSMALGTSEVKPIEMAEAYSVFMLMGDRVRPYPVTRVTGPDGETIRSFEAQRWTGALDPSLASVMDEAMHETVIKGTATQILAPELPEARGKTGTTQLAKDAWFCGYVDGVLGIGWVGNMQKSGGRWTQQRMADSVFGGTVTTIIWRDIMKEARKLHGSRIVPPAPDWVAAAPPEPKREEVVVEPPVTEPVPPVEEETVPEPPKEELPIAVDPSQFPGEGLDPSDPNASTPGLTPANPPTSTPEGERVPPPDERRRDRAIERERDRQAADARGQGAEMTTVEICVDSGRVATMYCPETVARKFPRGSVPSRRCRIHGTDD